MMIQTKMTKSPFLALNRMCLNNWHYISKKILSFNQEINFFTGHSGSGKSTVIDALQLVLYANTDGRGFFNKAAADDSDRSLVEYLRGMVTIGENNEFSYLRNQNFSSTIVLELKDTETGNCQCVGIVFDVETATNHISRRFFWHKGSFLDHGYRSGKRTMTIQELEEVLERTMQKEDFFTTSHNERFRRLLYDCYLGGLDSEKFPLLFKRAIPFRMNIRLEDFVREYICTEQNIHIEDMQESVMQYGRMRQKIEETCREIKILEQIKEAFGRYSQYEKAIEKYTWFTGKLSLMDLRSQAVLCASKSQAAAADLKKLQESKASEEEQLQALSGESDQLLRQIASTGYEDVKKQLQSLNELLERMEGSRAKWERTAAALKQWEEEETASNQTLWDIEEFENGTITGEHLRRLKKELSVMEADTQKQRQEAVSLFNELKKKEKQAGEELSKLRAGSKAYPKYLEEARDFLQRRLLEETGKGVEVHVLADLLDVKEDEWRNAVEGYLGNNKLNLVVPPKYAKTALSIYRELDERRYFNVSVLDTEKAQKASEKSLSGALSEEVTVREAYLKPYMDFLLGKVIKCRSLDELKDCKIGITPDCLLYHSFRLQHLNPDHYTKYAYIGKDSLRRRIHLLESELASYAEQKAPLEMEVQQCRRILSLEFLKAEEEEYLQWKKDIEACRHKQDEKKKLIKALEALKEQDVSRLEKEREAILDLCRQKKKEMERLERLIIGRQNEIASLKENRVRLEERLLAEEGSFVNKEDYDKELSAFLAQKEHPRYDRERETYLEKIQNLTKKRDEYWESLLVKRGDYLRDFPNRSLPLSAHENSGYEHLLETLSCSHLEEYRLRAAEQARSAVEHFKNDFIYKIRSAIKEAILRKDELNRIINRLDFGKDKYQFVIGRSKGPDGRFYDMFMDDSLEVNPSQLASGLENQMNLFTMEHENHYGALMNELIGIFIPPENATAQELEESRRNMEKYADYRTYLSFDMQQLIQNEDEVIKIRLSQMMKKNSGGEGQNPLYVALLASFAQAYRIGQSGGSRRGSTLRLVVLDEAFSKMDAEKVASCIELIRGLGFQAIISATNDKIQNYVENVDKTFVFANPNKRSISIQEFERTQFPELVESLEE